jgi:hypothetical protein
VKSKKLVNQLIKELNDPEIPVQDKKRILVSLATIDSVEAFRAIEKYFKAPDPELREWSILAYQESRMIIQSSLLDEQQVYISTGLGGKDQKLRYFAAFIGNDHVFEFSAIQQRLFRTELEFALSKNDGILEEMYFQEDLIITLLLLPVKSNIQSFFVDLINECNQYGDFIRQDVIITNVKRLTVEEIRQFIAQGKE